MLDMNVLTVLTEVDALKNKYHADGVKVYFKSIEDYTIKVIKDEQVIRTFRKGRGQFDKLL